MDLEENDALEKKGKYLCVKYNYGFPWNLICVHLLGRLMIYNFINISISIGLTSTRNELLFVIF